MRTAGHRTWRARTLLPLLLFGPVLLFFLLNLLFPFEPEISWSREVLDRQGEMIHASLSEDDKWRLYADLSNISPDFVKAILHKEDRWFYYHPGVNPLAMGRALFNNSIRGRRSSGASTVPMQVARLLDPAPRTYASKVREIFRALQLSMLYSKSDVLELYLNLLPYGGNVEGIRSAALLYLNKSTAQLSPAEISALCIIPNRPISLRPGRHNEALLEARNEWLHRFAARGIFDEEELLVALQEPFEPIRRAMPREAPHLARRLLQEHPGERVLISTLDGQTQKTAARMIQNHVERFRPYGIQNACVLVLDNATAEVLAYVGSADFHDQRDAGQVDGLRALRSPGSALKPLLYALAMDSGLITPQSVLLDVPVQYGNYRPLNFDREFAGTVSAAHALAHSLNIPAVRLLNDYGPEQFRERLEKAACPSLRQQKGAVGLSMVLGGCGIRPEELGVLYMSMANGGRIQAPRYILDQQPARDSSRLMSEAAAWAIGDMLSRLSRPDMPLGLQRTEGLPLIAWKTGTSYGRRDAWSLGYNARYTIAVWTGNFSGQGVEELTGAGVSAPLLFDLFQAIDHRAGKDWQAMPESLQFRYVCSQSGRVPAEFCTELIMDYYLPLISPAAACAHMRTIHCDAQHTMSYCMDCRPAQGYALLELPNLDPALQEWYRTQGIAFASIPPHNPKCERVFGGQAPTIVSPVEGYTYLRHAGSGKIALQGHSASEVQYLHWYVNDVHQGSAIPGESLFFEPRPGRNKVSVADDLGRTRSIWIEVESL